jgi:hypothetical protein
LSVWHGSSDRTVDPSNAAALIDQWRGLHGLPPSPTATETIEGQPRRIWCNEDGSEVIEEYRIEDMGHGTPIHPSLANEGEAAGPHMLDVGISSTRRLVHFWGLNRPDRAGPSAAHEPTPVSRKITPRPMSEREQPAPPRPSRTNKVQHVIENALRSAGLMR